MSLAQLLGFDNKKHCTELGKPCDFDYVEGYNEAVSKLEAYEVDEERLARFLWLRTSLKVRFVKDDKELYMAITLRSCRLIARAIIQSMSPESKDAWIVKVGKK